jgi:hypothetical protein
MERRGVHTFSVTDRPDSPELEIENSEILGVWCLIRDRTVLCAHLSCDSPIAPKLADRDRTLFSPATIPTADLLGGFGCLFAQEIPEGVTDVDQKCQIAISKSSRALPSVAHVARAVSVSPP